MLRITRIVGAHAPPVLKLEGKLLEPWVGEVRRACAEPGACLGPLLLDLSAVTFVDAAGIDLLRELIRQGMGVTACSDFVAELLDREPP